MKLLHTLQRKKNNDDIADKYDPHEVILLRVAKRLGNLELF